MVTCTEWISGTGSIIDCLHHGPIPENVINTYCYIMGTFSVPRHYVDFDTQIGYHVAETGVGPYNPREDFIEVMAFYLRAPFVLFLQGLMFYTPHLLYKYFEGGKVSSILAGLQQWVLDDEERHSKESELAKYLVETSGTHLRWCLLVIFAKSLYIVNVIGQIFFTDCFLGYEFTTYGVSVATLLEQATERRIDPMSRVFPRMTKCTFQKYGPSGTIQRHDAQCVLPINIINEKIYVFLFFWFIFLTVVSTITFLFDLLLIFNYKAKVIIIRRKLRLSPRKNNLNIDVNLICKHLDFGDWKLLYHLLRNMDSLVFKEFCEHFTDQLQKKLEPADSILKLKDLEDSNENLNRTSPSSPPNKGDFLTLDELRDGNYLKAPSPTGSHKESSVTHWIS